jgi:hypothetical protein
MNISSASSAVSAALQSASTADELNMAVAEKAMDAEKQNGANALQLILASGKGGHVDHHA